MRTLPPCWNRCRVIRWYRHTSPRPCHLHRSTYFQCTATSCCCNQNGGHDVHTPGHPPKNGEHVRRCHLSEYTRSSAVPTVCRPSAIVCRPSAIVCRPSAIVCRPSATVRRPSATVCRPSATVRRPSETVRRPSTTVRRPTTTVCSASATIRSTAAKVYRLCRPKFRWSSPRAKMPFRWMSLYDQGLPRRSRLHQVRPLQERCSKQPDSPPKQRLDSTLDGR
jgi:hypothetical protein